MRFSRGVLLGILGIVCLITSFAYAGIDAGQLVGSWVHVGAADMQALEFTKEGKVLVYYGGGNDAMTADYSIMDDGRLNFSMGGQSNFFLPALSGDQLQLKQPETGNVSQYRRLKSGETIAAAIAGQAQADQKAVQDRNAALPDFLKRQDLVMLVDGGGANVPAASAIAFAPNGNEYAGHICYGSKPPRVETITAQIQGSADNPIAVISFPQNPNLGQVSFRLAGAAPDVSLTAAVNFGGTFDNAPNHTATIKSDPDLHKQILDQLKGEVDRLNALRTPVIAMLKDYVVLKGISQPMMPQQGASDDEFVLSRNPQNNTWIGQGQSVNHTTGATEIFPVMAAVGTANGKPAVQILSQKRLYQFTDIDTTGGKLSGAWQMPNNPNGHPAELAITQAVDAKGRDQLFATRKTALQQMAADTVFHAVINDQYTNGTQPPNPLTVTLSGSAGGALSGKAEYPLEGCTMTLSGKEVDTPLGPQLQLHYTAGQADPGAWGDVAAFINLLQHETWVLSPSDDASGVMRLSGYAVTNPSPGAAPIALQLIPYTDKDKADIAQALSSGAHFKLVHPQVGAVPDTILEFTGDNTTAGKIDGRVSAGGAQLGAAVGTTFSGEIKDQAGWAELTMPIDRPNSSRPIPVYAYTIVVTPTDGGLYLNACQYNITQGASRPFARWDAVQVKP